MLVQNKRSIILVIFFLFAGGFCVIQFKSAQKRPQILSPVPDISYAKVIKKPKPPTPTVTPTLTPTPTEIPTPTESPTPTPTPITIAPADLDALFTKYSHDYSIDTELLKRIAKCESGFNPNATNSIYAGLFQFSEGLWISTRTLMGQNTDLNQRFNPEEAIRTAAFMISQNHLAIWPNCGK